MKLEHGVAQKPGDDLPRDPSLDKPLSATICHILAAVGIIGGVLWIFAGLLKFYDSSAFYIGIGCAIGGVVWWVVGDLVANTARSK